MLSLQRVNAAILLILQDDSVEEFSSGQGVFQATLGLPSNFSSLPYATGWNEFLPSKVKILSWRVTNWKIATSGNLDRRGIDLDSIRCPLCNEDI
ncbi:RNA-directed DNA polymerase, eukaryota, reverse transcriptase zinc-binding domain protein [Tanacetum coccineum]